jgi:phage N-6-adenine-methyltransferase
VDIFKGEKSDEWGTPPELLADLGLGIRDALDVCASPVNAKFEQYWTKDDDCLVRSWPHNKICWMNPPFSKATAFFRKAVEEAQKGAKIVAIYKSTNLETSLWQNIILPSCDGVLFLKGRTEYVREQSTGKGVPFGSALIFFNIRKDVATRKEHMGFWINTHGGEW